MNKYEKAALRSWLYEKQDLLEMRAYLPNDEALIKHLMCEIDCHEREVKRLDAMLHKIQSCMGYEYI